MIIHKGNLDKWFFDYFEGNLSSHEILELREYLDANPSAHADFEAWKETYQSSKKKSNRIPVYAGASGLMVEATLFSRINWNIAALIAIILGSLGTISYFSFQNPEISETALATANLNNFNQQSLAESEENVIEAEQLDELSSDDSYYSHEESNTYENSEVFESEETAIINSLANNNSDNTNKTNAGNSNITEKKVVEHEETNNVNSVSVNVSGSNESHLVFQSNGESDLYKENEVALSVNDDEISFVKTKDPILFDHSGINKKSNVSIIEDVMTENEVSVNVKNDKYRFLDFSKVAAKGLSNNKSSGERKLESSENIALITEEQKRGKENDKNYKHRKIKIGDKELSLFNVHDPIFVKSYQLPLQNNYALAGNLGLPRIKFGYRNQYANTFSQQTSYLAAADWYVSKIQAGIGVNYQQHELGEGIGDYQKIGLTYSQKVEIDRVRSFSIAAHYDYSSVNLLGNTSNKLYYLNNGQKVLINNSLPISKTNNNLALSGWYDGQRFYGGFTVNNLLFSKNTISNLLSGKDQTSIDYSMQIGTDYKKMTYSNFVVSPQLIYQKRSKTHEVWLGATVKYYWLVAGASVSSQNTGKVIAGVQNNRFRLLYGYDVNNSSPESGLYNSHELSLRILFGTRKANWSRY